MWGLSPIDLIPEFLPVIGPLDDVVVVALMLRYAGRSVPREVLVQAWPGTPDLLQRLLGPPRDTAGSTPEDDHHPGHHLIPGVPLPAGTQACAADKGGPAGLAL